MQIEEIQKKINEAIAKESFGDKPKELYEPISYIMNLGGKRARPLLVLLAYALYKDNVEEQIAPSLAVEVFHNFSLIHDDIMDEAPLRRGKDTVHKKWNENIAILSGDATLVKAYDYLLKGKVENLPELITAFNKMALEVCEGQQFDMNFETEAVVPVEDYIEMIRLKTAVLLGFSLAYGGRLAGASAEDIQLLNDAGNEIGIGFQIKDDYLDTFGNSELTGKQVGGDILADKKTFLMLKSLERASKEQLNELSSITNPQEKVKAFQDFYRETGVDEEAKSLMNTYFEKGLEKFDRLNIDSSRKEPVINYFKYLINRDK